MVGSVDAPLSSIPAAHIVTSYNSRSHQQQSSQDLSLQERQQVTKLQNRDRVVRAHEAAHITAGAGLIKGSANYNYERGPDGKMYAIGGHVNIDTSGTESDPQQKLRKAEQIRTAALAPSQPSAQDRSVATKAAQMAIEARAELKQQQHNSSQNSATNNFTIENQSATGNNLNIEA